MGLYIMKKPKKKKLINIYKFCENVDKYFRQINQVGWVCPSCRFVNYEWEGWCKGCKNTWGNFPTPETAEKYKLAQKWCGEFKPKKK